MKNLILSVSILFLFVFNYSSSYKLWDSNRSVVNTAIDSTVTISISVVGDLMCHSPQFEYAKVDKDSFDFDPPFKEVKYILSASDFTFGNFETVTAGKENGGYTGYPFFNSPASYITTLKNIGFDLLITANNHALDRGEKGITKTIESIQQNNLNYIGTFLSEKDRDSVRIFSIKGIKIAFLAYSYGTNGNPIPKGKSFLINLINYDLIAHDIKTARKDGAELVLVNYHFGEEYKRLPVKFQTDVVDKTIELGADIIIGGHPHVIQPVKFFKTQDTILDTGFVAYSMGNFFSNQSKRYTDAGMILTIKINKNFNTNKIQLEEVDFIPTWVYHGNISNRKGYLILPAINSSASDTLLSTNDYLKMKQAFSDTRDIVTKYSINWRLKEVLE